MFEMFGSYREYYWYDTEDGQDILKKFNFLSKWGVAAAIPLVGFDALGFPQSSMKGYGYRYCLYVLPAVGMCGMFTLTSQLLCKHVPQIDPKISFACGGVAAGTVLGAVTRSMTTGSIAGFYFGIIAAFARSLHENGLEKSNFAVFSPSLNNDDLFLSEIQGKYEPFTLPPPAARPAFAPSTLYGGGL